MGVLVAWLVFAVVTAATGAVALAVYVTFVGGPDPRRQPYFLGRSALAVAVVALAWFAPFPANHLLAGAVWWLAATERFGLPPGRAAALVGAVAALSLVSRLAVPGALGR
jgi:hypothetical protein